MYRSMDIFRGPPRPCDQQSVGVSPYKKKPHTHRIGDTNTETTNPYTTSNNSQIEENLPAELEIESATS